MSRETRCTVWSWVVTTIVEFLRLNWINWHRKWWLQSYQENNDITITNHLSEPAPHHMTENSWHRYAQKSGPSTYTGSSPRPKKRKRAQPWASAHRGKWGQLTPWKNGWKIKKRKHAKKSSLLTTYLFRYTSECTISYSNFLRLRRQGGIDPLTKILRTP